MVMRMTKCEKCIHGDICAIRDCMDADDEIAMTYCAHFIGKADFVEVVRCKDCKYYETDIWDGEILCGCNNPSGMQDVSADGYCSYGKRKGGEAE